ncbi:type 2 periplasmic-binding domain-containing protein [Vallitalea okinawensis]|uniref:extracellular solute-binding protein n=1 Tax=Vallitalea okinawensis TaxID=2078660 RepID=UPI000CFC610B|nr:extracellular solute-binding protein [Vallitalea okinawensis]
MMIKWRKIISLALVVSLVVSLVVGCASDSQETNESTKVDKTSQGKEGKAKDQEELVELTMITHKGEGPDESSLVYQELQRQLGIKINVIETTVENRKEKVNISLATGEIPDLFFTSAKPYSEEMQKWIKQGLILPYDAYMDDYPVVKAQLEKFPDAKNLTNNQYYMLNIQRQVQDAEVVNDHAFFVRTDWMENLGIEMPTTFDELNDLLYAFTFDDPDGNGKNDTFGVTMDSTYWLYFFYNMFDASERRFTEVDDEWVPEALTDNMKDAVKYLNKLYSDGVLDQEFMISKSGRVYENFVSGKAGVMIKNAGIHYNVVYDQLQDAYPEQDPQDMFTWMPIVAGPESGVKRLDGGANYWAATCLGNTGDEVKIQKSLELLNFLGSEEGQKLFFYGVEGEHYKMEGDKIVSLLPEGKQLHQVEKHGELHHLVVWLDGLFPEAIPNAEECLESYKDSMAAANGDPLLYVDVDVDPAVQAQVKEYTIESLIKLIADSEDVESDWQAHVDGWYNVGQEYQDAVNEAMN